MLRKVRHTVFIALSILVALSCQAPAVSINFGGSTPTPTAAPTRTLPTSPPATPLPVQPTAAATATARPLATLAATRTLAPATAAAQPTAQPTAGDGGGSAGVSFVTFQDPEGFYTLQVPKGWVQRKSGSQQQFCSAADGRACIAVSLRIKAIEPTNVVQETLDLYADRTSGFRAKTWESLEIDGYDAAWANISYTLDGQKREGAVAAAVRNRVGYQLEFWTPEGQFGLFGPIFEQTAAQMKIARFKDAPDFDEWQSYDSDSITFYYLKNTWAGSSIAAIAEEHEKALAAIQDAIGTIFGGWPQIWLYPSAEALYHATYRDAGFAIDTNEEVHALWISSKDHQTPGHELTHVVMYDELGPASQALLGEGLAVCLDQSGRDFRAVGRELLNQGKLVPLKNLLGDAWFKVDSGVAYAESGSFVCYFLEEYGMMGVAALYMSENFENALPAATGGDATLASVERDWKNWLVK